MTHAIQDDEMTVFKQMKFPRKLHFLLEKASTSSSYLSSSEESTQVRIDQFISWSPNGTSFLIHDKDEFARIILPTYFPGMSSYKSFRRQLTLYDIQQEPSSNDKNKKSSTKKHNNGKGNTVEYAHPFLLQGHAHLIERIRRPPSKKGSSTIKSLKKPAPEAAAAAVAAAVSESQSSFSLPPAFDDMVDRNAAFNIAFGEQKYHKPQIKGTKDEKGCCLTTDYQSLYDQSMMNNHRIITRDDDVDSHQEDCKRPLKNNVSSSSKDSHHDNDTMNRLSLLPRPLPFPTSSPLEENIKDEIIETFFFQQQQQFPPAPWHQHQHQHRRRGSGGGFFPSFSP